MRKKSLIESFWDGVNPQSKEECWLWEKTHYKDGYGQIWDGDKKKNMPAHRASYLLHIGNFDQNLCVLHKCDNPDCVNPWHLFLSTQQDNIIDCVKKGRHSRLKLTKNQVLNIRSDNRTQREIAKDFGVNRKTIWMIKNRKIWRHLK